MTAEDPPDYYMSLLAIAGDWAAISTAAVAVLFFVYYHLERKRKRLRLERYLKDEKARNNDEGQRSITHLIRHVAMSENDIMDSAFRSKRVRLITGKDKNGFATKVMLEYID